MDESVAYLLRNKVKRLVLHNLKEQKTIATVLAKKLKKNRVSISRAFIELKKIDLVCCENPNSKLARVYSITPKGRRILKEAQKILHENEE